MTTRTVPELILAQAQASPEAVAVESAGDRLTYAQLIAQAAGLADHLRGLGVRPGDLVAVAVPRRADLVATLLGVQLCGAAYLPLDPEHPAERLSAILADAGARVLVTADAAAVPGLRAPVRVHLGDVAVRRGPAEPPQLSPRDAAYVIYTSGSTGRPKGVLVSHGALANLIASMRERPGLPGDVVLPAVTTVSFDIAALELFLPLTTGGRVVVARPAEASDPHRLAALLARTGARVLQATPVTWRLLLEAGWSPPPGFTVLCGGERLPAALRDRLLGDTVVLWDLYGPTETTVWSAVTRYERGTAPEFHPVRETSLHLLDESMRPATTGELYIGGHGLADGYPGSPGLTAARFVADPFAAAGARLYRTGDVARRHPGGRVEIVGRSDDQVKIRGFRVEPGEIESVLATHPGVAEAAVRAVGNGDGDLRLVGYLRPADPADPPEAGRLRRHLTRSLPAYLIPAQFVVLDRLPTTLNGKLDRSALPAPATPDEVPAATEGGTGQRAAEVMAAVLERADVGPDEDFFALGGDSLRAVQAIQRLNADLGTQVPINALFEARTAAALAVLLDGDGTDEPSLVPLDDSQPARMSTAQWRLWLHQRTAPQSVAGNVAVAVPLPGPVDVGTLSEALTGLVARHDILRTRYEVSDTGQPVPVVQPGTEVTLRAEDGDPEAVLAAELALPFDLATAPPLRVRLIRRTASGPAHLILVLHEIAADGRSRELLAGQLRAAYRGRPVTSPAVRYADYASWQRDLAAGGTARRHLDFWRTTLTGLRRAGLRTDRARPAIRDWRGAGVRFTVPRAVADRLRDTVLEHDATLPMGLLAGLFAVLEGWTDGTDLTVGVPVDGRSRAELENLIGMVENTAVLRVEVGGGPTFGRLLTRVREAGLAAFGRAVPAVEDIEAAVLDVTGGTEPGRNALFDVVFTPHRAGEPGGLPPLGAPGTRYDLGCQVVEQADGSVEGLFSYATQLFDEATIDRLAGDYVRVLTDAVEDPARPLGQALV